MRIIDKNHDFYDYLQDSTDTLVFDRRNSFLLTKEYLCRYLGYVKQRERNNIQFILLQCGATFWLFMVKVTGSDSSDCVTDYDISLLISWKNYDKPNKLLKLDIIKFYGFFNAWNYKLHDYDIDKVQLHVNDIKAAIDQNDFKIWQSLNSYTKYTDHKNNWIKEERTLPLLKGCGIGNIIDPVEIFTAIEEYFSIEKTASERTEAIGATNNDKIIMHGFDTKTSFRGKGE